jgi:hypothetical protein
LGVAPLLIAAPGYALQLRLAPKAGQSGVSAAIPNASNKKALPKKSSNIKALTKQKNIYFFKSIFAV